MLGMPSLAVTGRVPSNRTPEDVDAVAQVEDDDWEEDWASIGPARSGKSSVERILKRQTGRFGEQRVVCSLRTGWDERRGCSVFQDAQPASWVRARTHS